MILSIAAKEVSESFLSARFVASTVVSVVLVLTTIVVLTGTYEEQARDYAESVRQQESFIDSYGHLNRVGWMSSRLRPPSYFQVLVLGIDREAEQLNFISNPVAALLSRLDFVSIVSVIFSLMAILFSYDAISGEREAGTLRQLLAVGVSRRSVLLGKYLGGLTTIFIPFTVSVLGGYLYLALNPVVELRGVDVAVLAMLLAVSWLYIAVFFGVGLFFSASSHTSSQSVLKSLFAWVIVVLVIPNISPFLAAELYPIPSAAKIEQERYRIMDRERDQIVASRIKALLESKYPDLKPVLRMGRGGLQADVGNNPVLKAQFETFSHESDEVIRQVNKEQREIANKFSEEFEQRSQYQQSLATAITSVSPFANLVFIATDITETGIAAENRWSRVKEEYGGALWKYAEAQYEREKAKDPAFESNDYLDLRGRPRFEYQASTFGERVEPAIPQLAVLLLFNIVVVAGASIAFFRYDVR